MVSIAEIKQGEILTPQNIWVKRPGTGDIPAEKYECILGMHAKMDIPRDVHLSTTMIE